MRTNISVLKSLIQNKDLPVSEIYNRSSADAIGTRNTAELPDILFAVERLKGMENGFIEEIIREEQRCVAN